MSSVGDNTAESKNHISTEVRNGPRWGRESSAMLDRSQEMGPLATKIVPRDTVNEESTYYAVYIPVETLSADEADQVHVFKSKTDALEVARRHKNSMINTFEAKTEATMFALYGPDNCSDISTADAAIPDSNRQDHRAVAKLAEQGEFPTANSSARNNARSPLASPVTVSAVTQDSTSQGTTYFGIFIPKDTLSMEESEQLHVYVDKAEALKIVKRYKKARFKAFKTQEEAVQFAVQGSENSNSGPAATASDGATVDAASLLAFEKPSLFKGPKAQDLVQLRKAIECGDLQVVSSAVWSNPRYLVSSGDTPAILQEGSRYNALHVAAKARNTAMSEFVLQTVSDPQFTGLLYGDDNPDSCRERAAILLDLYLNTPDKGLNETPLHFAVKFGAVGVVEALVSCPQCDKLPRNKFGQTPKDIVCSRVATPDASLKKEILALLEERFYVPVFRSEDNSVQPVLGTPFSPASPPVLKTDPITPRMEIHAYAGPMSQQEAMVFRKKWKTPPRMQHVARPPASPRAIDATLQLRDTEKGLERVGRELAQEFKVSWKEFWPFLGIFTDLSTPEGLQKLEVYLKNRVMQVFMRSPPRDNCVRQPATVTGTATVASPPPPHPDLGAGDGAVSPITDLCLALKACSLSDTGNGETLPPPRTVSMRPVPSTELNSGDAGTEYEAFIHAVSNPGISPFLYVEKSCQVFAKRIADGLTHLVVLEEALRDSQASSESVFDMLAVEVKHLQVLVNSYMDDLRFVSVDFHLVHSRIATLIALKLTKLSSWDVELIVSCLKLALLAHKDADAVSSDEEEVAVYRTRRYTEQRRKTKASTRKHVRCLAQLVIGSLAWLENVSCPSPPTARVDTEEECMQAWSDAVPCMCNWHIHGVARGGVGAARKGASFKRSRSLNPVAVTDDRGRLSGACRQMSFPETDCLDAGECGSAVVNCIGRADVAFSYGDMSDTEEGSESDVDDTYYTPPTSPEEPSSEEEMMSADEGVGVYIEGEAPSKMDLAVLQAIQGCTITASQYPNVYCWQHLVMLHTEKERNSWANPATLRRQQRARKQSAASCQSSTPRSSRGTSTRNCNDAPSPAWHRGVAGRYAPQRMTTD